MRRRKAFLTSEKSDLEHKLWWLTVGKFSVFSEIVKRLLGNWRALLKHQTLKLVSFFQLDLLWTTWLIFLFIPNTSCQFDRIYFSLTCWPVSLYLFKTDYFKTNYLYFLNRLHNWGCVGYELKWLQQKWSYPKLVNQGTSTEAVKKNRHAQTGYGCSFAYCPFAKF